MRTLFCVAVLAICLPAAAQESPPPAETQSPPANYAVAAGTRVPLLLINSISTRSAREGDQVYLETAFPIVVNQKVVIPRGSYVKGTITQVKRPGRVKGRGEMYLRFDSLTLPNGVTRDFRGRVGAVDGSGNDTLEKREGKIQSEAAKGQDAGTVATTAGAGTAIGAIAGSASRHPGLGTGIGAMGGAAAGVAQVLLTRGPDVHLMRGQELDMVLDRALTFTEDELRFESAPQGGSGIPAPAHTDSKTSSQSGIPLPRRLPIP
jgi:hypothetical protein